MATNISAIRDTAYRESRTAAIAWFDGDADILALRIRSRGVAVDLTGATVTCAYEWNLGNIAETLDEADPENPTLETEITGLSPVSDAWATAANGTLTVTINDDPTTGMLTIAIPSDFYPSAGPDLVYDSNADVPVAVLVFTWTRSATQISQYRLLVYMRPMALGS